MASWQSGMIEANGLRLHYTRTGEGTAPAKPSVVLAHGFSDDGLCWTPVAEALESDYDVIMVDARGHGRSDAPEQGYGPADHAADLRDVIAGLGLRKPAVLGHSMGGATALALAGMYPDVPGAILIEDAGAFGMGAPARTPADDERRARWNAWVTGLKRKTREELIAAERVTSPRWSDAEFGPWADAKHRLSLNVLNRFDAPPIDWPALLPRITCPALLITADTALGAIITPEAAQELQTLVPGLRVAHIPGAGHSVRRDQFEHFMEVVRPFLAEWAASGVASPADRRVPVEEA